MGNESVDIAVLKNTLDQLLDKVTEIGDSLHRNDERVRDLELKLNTLENDTKSQQKEIDTLTKKLSDVNAKAWGAIIVVATGVIVAVIRGVLGV